MTTMMKRAFGIAEGLMDTAEAYAEADAMLSDYECDGHGEASVALDNAMFDALVQAMNELDIRYWLDDEPAINPNAKYRIWVECVDKVFGGRDYYWGVCLR